MIKLVRACWVQDFQVALEFSDGSEGIRDFAPLLARDTALTRPLREVKEFRRFFLELGALCWPHGLEFSAAGLRADLLQEQKLQLPLTAA